MKPLPSSAGAAGTGRLPAGGRMTKKRLLCIALGTMEARALLEDAMLDWDIRMVFSLADAARELRGAPFLVGLLMYGRAQHRPADVDNFLRRHGQMQWVGVFGPRDL